uniref:Integrase n=1 Tax=Pseudomonas phage RVTF4 TaxID=3236931 RepID=A0AB39CCS6_9VIRU
MTIKRECSGQSRLVNGITKMFYNDFSDVSDVISNYRGNAANDLDGAHVIHADYTYEDYSGSSYVLYYKDGKYFEVHGSHCSCYGLEDQWEPEEVTITQLMEMVDRGSVDTEALLNLHRFMQLKGRS